MIGAAASGASGGAAVPGAQRERTALAWSRTALVVLVGGGLLVRVNAAVPLLQVVGYVAMAAGAVIGALAARRTRPDGPAYARRGALPAVGMGATVMGLAALASIVARLG